MRGLLIVAVATLLVPDPPADPSAEPEPPPAEHVVVVGVGGLRWDDVGRADPADLPNLRALATRGSVGTLSVRSAPSATCPSEGWLTLGAGTYAAAYDPGAIDAAAGCAPRPVPPVHRRDGAGRVPAAPRVDRLNRDLRFGARTGWLAGQLPCVTAVGEGAALAVADPAAGGRVPRYAPALPPDPAALLADCPATLVDAGTLPRDVGPDRTRALDRLDGLLGRIDAARAPGTVVMVLGVSETDGRRPHLHLAVADGPGFAGGDLRSASTRRAPYVQLVDVAPTVLDALGHDVADTVAGRPFTGGHATAAREAREQRGGLDATVHRLADTDTRSVQQRRVLGPFFALLGIVVALLCTTLIVLLAAGHRRAPGLAPPAAAELGTGLAPRRWRRPTGAAPVTSVTATSVDTPGTATRIGRWLTGLRTGMVGLAAVPAGTFLANLVPWWRSSVPLLAVAGAVLTAAATILAVAVLAGRIAGSGTGRVRTEVGVVAAVTAAVFLADAVTGARLQMASLLGYNPVVAGRFVGFGNIAFSVLAAGTVVLAALLAAGRTRRRALLAVGVVAGPVLVVDALPAWGADFGGVLTLVPTFTVLTLLVTRTRVTWRRLAAAQVAGAAVVGGLAWLDYRRPADARSHFGRFVGSVVDGTAAATIERKWLTSWELLFMGPHTLAALGLAVGLVYVVVRPPDLLRRAAADHPPLRPMLLTTVVLAVVGLATNDSGVAIPAVISLVTVPSALALCAASPTPAALTPTAATASSGGAAWPRARRRGPRPRPDRSAPTP